MVVHGHPAGWQEPHAPDAIAGLNHYARNPDGPSSGLGQGGIYEEGQQQRHEMCEVGCSGEM